jgi:hypothetical protein
MFKLIPGNSAYKISLTGKVVNGSGVECILPTTGDKVSIKLYGIKQIYRGIQILPDVKTVKCAYLLLT